MSGWVRLGVVLGAMWIVVVSTFALTEYLFIPNYSCVFPPPFGERSDYNGIFFHCDLFTDIPFVEDQWKILTISDGRKVVDFHLDKFIFVLLLPVAILWALSAAAFYCARWVCRGFSKNASRKDRPQNVDDDSACSKIDQDRSEEFSNPVDAKSIAFMVLGVALCVWAAALIVDEILFRPIPIFFVLKLAVAGLILYLGTRSWIRGRGK